MCLTEAALWLFLSLLPPEIISATDTEIIVHATEGDTIWRLSDGIWCNSDIARLRP
jgi:hypothetical protein